MPHSSAVELILEVPRHGEPVSGRLRGAGGDRPFSGWIEFCSALEGLGAWTAATVRLTLEPAASASGAARQDADSVAGWLSLAAALQVLSHVGEHAASTHSDA